jgi:DHA2 family multidrug resistance protein
MVPNLSPYNPVFQQRLQQIQHGMAARSGSPVAATQQAYGAIYGTAVKQAMVLSYIDNFRLLAFMCVLCVPAALLFKRVKARKGPVAVH